MNMNNQQNASPEAIARHARQLKYDMLHHRKRIADFRKCLTTGHPVFGHATLWHLIVQSERSLRMNQATYSVDLNDLQYLELLDAWEREAADTSSLNSEDHNDKDKTED